MLPRPRRIRAWIGYNPYLNCTVEWKPSESDGIIVETVDADVVERLVCGGFEIS